MDGLSACKLPSSDQLSSFGWEAPQCQYCQAFFHGGQIIQKTHFQSSTWLGMLELCRRIWLGVRCACVSAFIWQFPQSLCFQCGGLISSCAGTSQFKTFLFGLLFSSSHQNLNAKLCVCVPSVEYITLLELKGIWNPCQRVVVMGLELSLTFSSALFTLTC